MFVINAQGIITVWQVSVIAVEITQNTTSMRRMQIRKQKVHFAWSPRKIRSQHDVNGKFRKWNLPLLPIIQIPLQGRKMKSIRFSYPRVSKCNPVAF